ncbi:MAG: HAMP domain-containing histidine kinase [Bacteroidetes bacterium]|nr:HAMP domain-containing histidine kinase [Bacteroidota bacterium]
MKRSLLLLYILAFYILFQFCWWSYLLVSLNDEVLKHRIENVSLQHISDEAKALQTQQLTDKITQKRWMVLGEGMVFLALLSWGTFVMVRAYRKEMALARQQKNFLLSITHEFKSPLASIKLYLQTLLRHDLDKQKEKSFINSAISDTERLNTLVENALMANLIDYNGYAFSKEDVNISAMARLLIQKFQQVPDHAHINSDIEEGLYVNADKNGISILLNNLLENGWKYSPKGKDLEVKLWQENKFVYITVADHGVGVPEKEKEKIFTKFYRIGNEETRKTKGTGLGLFIVRYIVEEHDGKITIEDNVPSGAIFKVRFPLLSK